MISPRKTSFYENNSTNYENMQFYENKLRNYYKRITNQFIRFFRERKTDLYTTEIGKQFSEDVLGIKTGEFNISKYHYLEIMPAQYQG